MKTSFRVDARASFFCGRPRSDKRRVCVSKEQRRHVDGVELCTFALIIYVDNQQPLQRATIDETMSNAFVDVMHDVIFVFGRAIC